MQAHCTFKRRSKLEFEFKDEVGTGTGPTVEFYSRCADFLRMKKFDLFMNQSSDTDVYFVENIFPKPETSISEDKKVKWWLLGCLIGKLLLEKRYLDIPLSTCLLKILSKEDMTTTDDKMAALKTIDPVRFDLLKKLTSYSENEIASLCLNMTYNDCALVENGENIDLSLKNVKLYKQLVLEFVFEKGINEQLRQFKSGFEESLSIDNLYTISAGDENFLSVVLTGHHEINWTFQSLLEAIEPVQGYGKTSQIYLWFLEVLVEFDNAQRKKFLKFIMGTTALPPGGMINLKPNLQVGRKRSENPQQDNNLVFPSINTCSHYLKLPAYDKKEVLKNMLIDASSLAHEGFHYT